MVDFIFSHFTFHRKIKKELGGHNIVRAGNYYLLTDSGRIAKRHIGIRLARGGNLPILEI